MSALASTVLTALLAPPQDAGEVLARYQLRGAPAVVTRTDVAYEMAQHMRRRDRGTDAAGMLVDTLLTRREAERLGVMPTEAEARAFWSKLQDQLRAAGHRPEEFAAVRNSDERQWLADLAVQLAQKRLVRRELSLRSDDEVTGDMLQLWLVEARKRTPVVTDPDRLPAGVAVRVGDSEVPLLELGLLLLRTSEDHERDKMVRQIVYLESLEALAARETVTVTPEDLDAAIARRRQDAQRDPRYRGVSFENLLQAEGLTVPALRELRVFRAQVLLDKLALRLYPDAKLQQELTGQRQQVLDAVGPRRHVGIVLVRALDEPNALITRDFAAAAEHLVAVRERIAKDGFRATASIESEHGPSKARGGDVGWHRRQSDALPEPLLQAAFALAAGEVSMPIRGDDGCYLVTVFDVEPVPTDAELIVRLRELRGTELAQRLIDEADLQFVGAADREGR